MEWLIKFLAKLSICYCNAVDVNPFVYWEQSGHAKNKKHMEEETVERQSQIKRVS